MKILILSFIIISILSPIILLNSNNALFIQANKFYENKQYNDAIMLYEKISKKTKNSDVYYNLGNAYFKSNKKNKLSLALLNYYKAEKISPRDKEIKMNIAFLNSIKKDKKIKKDKNIFIDIISDIYNFLSLNEWTYLILVGYIILFILLILRLFNIKRSKIFIIIIISLEFIISPFAITKIYDDIYSNSGILITEKAIAKSEPQNDCTEMFTIHEGTTFKIQKKQNGWVQISLANGLTGWIINDNIKKL